MNTLTLAEVDELQQQRMNIMNQVHGLLGGVANREMSLRLDAELEEMITLSQIHTCHHSSQMCVGHSIFS